MRYLFFFSVFALLACQKTFHYVSEFEPTDSHEIIDLTHYDLYAYSICADEISSNGVTEIYNCPPNAKREDVIEEIYLLYPKNDIHDRVLLLSTLSYVKNPQREFSREIYKSAIDISDIDFIFVGRLNNETIDFFANKKKYDLKWEFDKRGDKIEIVSVPYLEKRKTDPDRLQVREVLRGGVVFTRQERDVAFQYRWNRPRKGCEINRTILTCNNITINHESNRDKVVFTLKNTTDCDELNNISFRNRRLWYYDEEDEITTALK